MSRLYLLELRKPGDCSGVSKLLSPLRARDLRTAGP